MSGHAPATTDVTSVTSAKKDGILRAMGTKDSQFFLGTSVLDC